MVDDSVINQIGNTGRRTSQEGWWLENGENDDFFKHSAFEVKRILDTLHLRCLDIEMSDR